MLHLFFSNIAKQIELFLLFKLYCVLTPPETIFYCQIPTRGFEKENFIYDKENNIFICPAEKTLKSVGSGLRNGIKKLKYQCKECIDCKYYDLCTTSKNGRSVELSENFEIMEKFRNKVKTDLGKKIISKRKELVEHPFGTIKRNFGYTYFMQTGIEKAKSEFSFMAFIYNLKRVINLVGIKNLIEILN